MPTGWSQPKVGPASWSVYRQGRIIGMAAWDVDRFPETAAKVSGLVVQQCDSYRSGGLVAGVKLVLRAAAGGLLAGFAGVARPAGRGGVVRGPCQADQDVRTSGG